MEDSSATGKVASEELYSNLQILGFEGSVEANWARGTAGGDASCLGKGMFDRATANETGMIAVLHFLLVKIKGSSAKKEFASCFPVVENAQRREFKTKAREMLAVLEREKIIPIGTGRGSVLNMSKGRAANILVWVLSLAAMRKYSAFVAKSKLNLTEDDLPLLADVFSRANNESNPEWQTLVQELKTHRLREELHLENSLTEEGADTKVLDEYCQQLIAERESLEKEIEEIEKDIQNRSDDIAQSSQVDHKGADSTRKSIIALGYSDSCQKASAQLEQFNTTGAYTEPLKVQGQSLSKVIRERIAPRFIEILEVARESGFEDPTAASFESDTRSSNEEHLSDGEISPHATNSRVVRPYVDKLQLDRCLEQIERVRREIGLLSMKISSGIEDLNRSRAENLDILLNMR